VFIVDEGGLGSDESEGKDWDELEQEAKDGINACSCVFYLIDL
jgi:hypothetical protein